MKQTKLWILAAILLFCGTTTTLVSCSSSDVESLEQKNYFQSWNSCEALTALKEYVEDVTNPQSTNFISTEDRIATFDMDGTFVGELYPTYFVHLS